MRRGEQLVEGLEAEARREELLHRGRSEQQLARAEAPRVDHRQAPGRARGPELDADPRVRRLALGVREDRAGHAQVLSEVDVAAEAPQQVLSAPAEALHPPALERVAQLMWRERARPARVEDLQPPQRAPLDQRRELAPDGLDLR